MSSRGKIRGFALIFSYGGRENSCFEQAFFFRHVGLQRLKEAIDEESHNIFVHLSMC